MDRLISEKQVINAIKTWTTPLQVSNSETIEDLWVNGVCELIKAIPSAEPYKGMTNGEVIKAMFPQLMIFEENASKVVWGRSESETKWWNSPYEPQESEDKE